MKFTDNLGEVTVGGNLREADDDDDMEDEGFDEALDLDDPTIAPPHHVIEHRSAHKPSTSSRQHGRHTLCPCLHH